MGMMPADVLVAIEENQGNFAAAARALGCTRQTVWGIVAKLRASGAIKDGDIFNKRSFATSMFLAGSSINDVQVATGFSRANAYLIRKAIIHGK